MMFGSEMHLNASSALFSPCIAVESVFTAAEAVHEQLQSVRRALTRKISFRQFSSAPCILADQIFHKLTSLCIMLDIIG